MRIIPSIRSPLLALVLLGMTAAAYAQIGISISFAPPELPIYEQPLCPGEGYLWTPGYWAYANDFDDYYWVPGTWVMAPEPGLLWTPAYWGWGGNGYVFYDGYWGQQVGFYGGISYGYGYFGEGYQGGRWQNGQFYYNRSVNNVNVTNIHNVYNTTVINNTTVNRVSYNGGNGGITARPRPEDEAAAREKHIPPVAVQTQHAQAALANPQQRASVNQGKPAIAATPKPGAFSAGVPAKEAGAPYNAAANRSAAKPSASTPAARPENNATRPGTAEHSTPAARNDVPRPPSASEKASTARPAGNVAQHESTPRPQTTRAAAPRPENAPHAQAAPQKSAPRPENTPRAVAAARPESAPHPQAAPRAATPRPENTPRPQAAARPENAPHAQPQAHQEAAARPQAQSHPEEKESRPEERRP